MMDLRASSGVAPATPAGLRPASAFVLVGIVLLVVAARAAQLAWRAPGQQPEAAVHAGAPWPEFEIVDRSGRPLAVSVECFDVTVSPRALWRSHTPLRMASAIAGALGVDDESALLQRMLPAQADARGGWIVPESPRLVRFGGDELERVQAWIDGAALGPDRPGLQALRGFELVPIDDGEAWTLAWSPAKVLSAAERMRQIGEVQGRRPERWTTRLLTDIAFLVEERGLPSDIAEELGRLVPSLRAPRLRDLLWSELCPSTFRLVAKRVDPVLAHDLAIALRAESVSPWQVQLVPRLERRHPARPSDVGVMAMGEGGSCGADPFAVLGHWGVLGDEDAKRQAAQDLTLAPHLLEWDASLDPLRARAAELGQRWRPWSGLEKLCADLLEQARRELPLDERPRAYTKRSRHVSRDRRARWPDKRVPDYFVAGGESAPIPRFRSTLDAKLQRRLHRELMQIQESFDPALSMAIALDVDSGDVLAVDGVQPYATKQFAPTQHVFTPGSTLKAVIMAMALDRGVVDPAEEIATYAPGGLLVRTLSGAGRARRIREALGAPTESHISASQGLAQSVNAVLVQIGLRMDAADLRTGLLDLGYGQSPSAGLGPERRGYLPDLDQGTWKRRYTHASIAFGHEIGVTLWQHSAALATIARGGIARDLRLVSGVAQGDQLWDLEPEPARRVLSQVACEKVLAMLALGAREGTGRRVAHPDQHPEFAYLGTKTGTTEKVESEVCIHVELAHALAHSESATSCSKPCYRSLRGQRDHKSSRRTCYTSSMMALGRLDADGPTVMVVVVVEDARSKLKFGADIAGKAAMNILRSAHGLPLEHGQLPTVRGPELGQDAFGQVDLPWMQTADEQNLADDYAPQDARGEDSTFQGQPGRAFDATFERRGDFVDETGLLNESSDHRGDVR